ncbi:organic cation transporter protein [Sitodiplosis mosellana]|uniref:organic cation transporter protein n=1 Tax=Sitodiplosis mosellana TaxID=263140 RepID=UPI002443AD4E|nr:organic cation transporter protein [Sitodiplosis mosellana]
MGLDHTLEELMGQLGEFGRFQGFQFFLHILSAFTAGMHMLSLVTVGATPEHRCFIEGIDTNTTYALWNSTEIKSAIPQDADGGLSSCQMYGANNISMPCGSYVYDRTYYQSSRTIEWDFVCDKRWMISIAQSLYMLGTFTGAITLGGLADKVGRKAIFCWSAVLQLILGVGVAFIPSYIPFLVVRYLYGIFGSAGSYITGFVLTMELVGASKRTACGISFQAAFAGGIMLVAAWGAIIPDRKWLQVIYGLHSCLLLFHYWLMDESPRWLWAQGRREEAVKIVAKGVKWNKNGIPLDEQYYLSKAKYMSTNTDDSTSESVGVSDLFKTPNLRMKTLNVCLCWFANALAYYGLSLSSGKLNGNPYLILFIMGLVELPSYIALVFTLDLLGRRSITSALMLVGGVCCIVAAYIQQGTTLATSIVMVGKFMIAGSFAVIYNYSAELFPTVVRNSAMGLGSMAARLSGALTPLITLLDSFDPTIPAVTFGVITLLSGSWVLFLPETNNQPMPETIADGESFGKGDTFFAACFGKRRKDTVRDEYQYAGVPMENVDK